MRAVDIIGTEDWHVIHVLYKWNETFDHDCMCFQLLYIYLTVVHINTYLNTFLTDI